MRSAATAIVPTHPPGAPRDVTAVAGQNQATVSFRPIKILPRTGHQVLHGDRVARRGPCLGGESANHGQASGQGHDLHVQGDRDQRRRHREAFAALELGDPKLSRLARRVGAQLRVGAQSSRNGAESPQIGANVGAVAAFEPLP